ncbi:MAG: hypothetical protein OEY61_08690 [Gammaproteobacteria bacterium]|nr:hypothetical protein [Gammaproteobacteria bacterium]
MTFIAKTVLILSVIFFISGMSVFDSESVDNVSRDYQQASAKSHVPVDVKYQLPKNIQTGEQVAIKLLLKAGQVAENLIVTVHADEGLLLMDANNQYSFGEQKKGQKSSLTLNVMAEADGLFYIYISASLVIDGQQQSGTIVIPLSAGNARSQKVLKQEGKVTQDSTGTPVISMPAVEATD